MQNTYQEVMTVIDPCAVVVTVTGSAIASQHLFVFQIGRVSSQDLHDETDVKTVVLVVVMVSVSLDMASSRSALCNRIMLV
jgi:uncharacterized membrane protein